MDLSRAYAIEPAKNGGVIVSNIRNDAPGRMPELVGAFTTPADMLAWLAGQYGVQMVPDSLMPVLHVKEVSPEMPAEWIEWGGGCCPVDLNDHVEVKFKDGSTDRSHMASWWVWQHRTNKNPRDIVAYRVVTDA